MLSETHSNKLLKERGEMTNLLEIQDMPTSALELKNNTSNTFQSTVNLSKINHIMLSAIRSNILATSSVHWRLN